MHKQTIVLASSTLAACTVAIALLWLLNGGLLAHAAPTDDLFVCPSGCTYSSIQAAVNAADNGDVVKVAQGAYVGVQNVASLNTDTFTATQIVVITKSITLRGGYNDDFTMRDPETYRTILNAQGQGRAIAIVGSGIAPTVEGLRVTGGDAADLGGVWVGDFWTGHVGGGIYVYQATAVISGNHVYSNTAPLCGGVILYQGDGTLTNNTVGNNTASDGGGAGICLRQSPATLNDNIVHSNTSANGWGGGITLDSSDATLNRNVVFENSTDDYGGGISVDFSAATLTNNRVYSNAADDEGGGIYIYNSYGVLLSGNIITGNTADRGGGIDLESGTPTLVNNVVADNQATVYGAGLYITRSSARLLHTTVARNTGGDGSGIHVTNKGPGEYSTVVMTNTIIVDHEIGITVTVDNTATLNATLWHANVTPRGGNVIHTNDYNGDPAFAPDGYHIGVDSLALDRGVAPAGGVTTDIDGDSRPQGAGYDLGADEFPSVPPDVAWEKRIRVGNGAFQAWNSGPFTVVPDELVTIVERVWITGSGGISFTLGEAWTSALEWESYDATIGNVAQVSRTAVWSAPTATVNAWHVLTKTLRAVASPDYAGTLTETLTAAGLPLQLPERILHFQQPRPQPAWEKTVRVNDGAPQSWDAGQFTVQDGDTLTIIDRGWVTHTADVTFTLAQVWGPGLMLTGQIYDVGTVVTGTGALTWSGSGESAYEWHTLTTTLSVVGVEWLYESITETLTVDGAASQLSLRVVSLLNLSGVGDCHARINDGATTYHTVQAAVDAAQPGDLVKLAGRCTAVNDRGGLAQIAYVTKGITLRGGYTVTNWTTPDPVANPTTLDALGRGRVLYIAGSIAPIIEGLRITGGDATGLGGMDWGDVGGGIYVNGASAVISGNVIYSNTTTDVGGGLFLYQSAATLIANTISQNTAPDGSGAGVALYTSPATLRNNVVRDNQGHDWGGGVSISGGDAELTGNTITGNSVVNGGGGVAISSDSGAMLTGNVITDNNAGHSAGVRVYFSDPVLSDNLINGNVAAAMGGGLGLEGGAPTLVNNVVADNEALMYGAGIYAVRTAAQLLHTTIARNRTTDIGSDGSGVYITSLAGEYSSVAMTNTIVVGHGVGVIVTAGNAVALNGTLWHANTTTDTGGAGSVTRLNDRSGDPAFAPDGYHLTSISAAIGEGIPAGINTDIDGQARPYDVGHDLGADEFVCVALTGGSIAGPETGTVGITYTFTVDATPPNASLSITYTWSPTPLTGQGNAIANYTWNSAGLQGITVTVENCGGTETITHTIDIANVEWKIYLPLVVRGG
jgi:parallel beta-helix repeat protein